MGRDPDLRSRGSPAGVPPEKAALQDLNDLPPGEAVSELLRVCGSRRWAEAVAAERPFADRASLSRAAEAAWDRLGPADWFEAFAAHPRIGQSRTMAGHEAGGWSRREQAGLRGADERLRASLAETQAAYERRFGHIFLIRAAGRGAEEILAACRARLAHDPATELEVAAMEERAIGRLRFEELLAEHAAGRHRRAP